MVPIKGILICHQWPWRVHQKPNHAHQSHLSSQAHLPFKKTTSSLKTAISSSTTWSAIWSCQQWLYLICSPPTNLCLKTAPRRQRNTPSIALWQSLHILNNSYMANVRNVRLHAPSTTEIVRWELCPANQTLAWITTRRFHTFYMYQLLTHLGCWGSASASLLPLTAISHGGVGSTLERPNLD